jgi:hypothetical protein
MVRLLPRKLRQQQKTTEGIVGILIVLLTELKITRDMVNESQ